MAHNSRYGNSRKKTFQKIVIIIVTLAMLASIAVVSLSAVFG